MLLAVDASLLTEGPAAERALAARCCRRTAGCPSPCPASTWRSWPSRTPMRGQHVAAALRDPGDQWRHAAARRPSSTPSWPRRCAAAATLERARELAVEAIAGATAARELDWEPEPDEADLLDVVQAWALTCADDLDGALGPLRRVRRHVAGRRRPVAARLHRPGAGPAARPAGRAGRRRRAAARRPIGLLVDAAGRVRRRGRPPPLPAVPAGAGPEHRRPGPPGRGAALAGGLPRRHRPRARPRPRDVGGDVRPPQPAARGRAPGRAAAPARAGGPAHRARQPAQRRAPAGRDAPRRGAAVAGRRRRRPVQGGQRRAPRTPTATPSCAGWPTCCASTAAPATRSTAGPATSSSSSCRRRPRRRPSSSWSGCAPPWPPPTGATCSVREPVTVSIGVATAPAADDGEPARSSAGGRCSTPPTCTCSPPSAAAATGCAPRRGPGTRGATKPRTTTRRRARPARDRLRTRGTRSDGGRRVPEHVLDSARDDVHSALVPPGALHQRVTAALANWQLDDAEELLAGVERDPSPYVAADPAADAAERRPRLPRQGLGRHPARRAARPPAARRRLHAGRRAGGRRRRPTEPALDLHAGVAELIDGGRPSDDADPRSESATRAALAIALVRSAKAAFDATDDDLQRAAGLARHARIELLSRRIDAAMDEAVEAASLLDPLLAPSALLIDTLGTLAGVLADLELMPLALDYQRRAHEAATAAAADPGSLGPDDGDPDVLVAVDRHLPRRALRRAGRGAARRRRPRVRRPALRRRPPARRGGAGAAAAGRARRRRRPGRARLGAGRARRARRRDRPAARRRPHHLGHRRPRPARLGAAGAGPGAAPAGRRHAPPTSTWSPRSPWPPSTACPGCAAPRCASCARCTPSSTTPAARCPTCRPTSPTSWTGSTSGAPAGSSCSAGARACWRPSGPPASCAARPTRTRSPTCPTAATPRPASTACCRPGAAPGAGRRRRRPVQVDQRRDRAPRRRRRAADGRRAARSPASATPTRCAAGPATST